jgi:hypothetical protein
MPLPEFHIAAHATWMGGSLDPDTITLTSSFSNCFNGYLVIYFYYHATIEPVSLDSITGSGWTVLGDVTGGGEHLHVRAKIITEAEIPGPSLAPFSVQATYSGRPLGYGGFVYRLDDFSPMTLGMVTATTGTPGAAGVATPAIYVPVANSIVLGIGTTFVEKLLGGTLPDTSSPSPSDVVEMNAYRDGAEYPPPGIDEPNMVNVWVAGTREGRPIGLEPGYVWPNSTEGQGVTSASVAICIAGSAIPSIVTESSGFAWIISG